MDELGFRAEICVIQLPCAVNSAPAAVEFLVTFGNDCWLDWEYRINIPSDCRNLDWGGETKALRAWAQLRSVSLEPHRLIIAQAKQMELMWRGEKKKIPLLNVHYIILCHLIFYLKVDLMHKCTVRSYGSADMVLKWFLLCFVKPQIAKYHNFMWVHMNLAYCECLSFSINI